MGNVMTLLIVVLAIILNNGNRVLSIDNQTDSDSSTQITNSNADPNLTDLVIENVSDEITTSTYDDVEELAEPIEITDEKEDQPRRRKYKVTIYRKRYPESIKTEQENTDLLKKKIQSWIANGQGDRNDADRTSSRFGIGDLNNMKRTKEENPNELNSYVIHDTPTKILWPAARVHIDIHHKYQAEKQRQIKEIVFVTLDKLLSKSSEEVAEEFIEHYKSFNSPLEPENVQLKIAVNLLLKYYSQSQRIPLNDMSLILNGLNPNQMKNLPYTYTVLIEELLKLDELTPKEKWVVGRFAPFSPESPSIGDFLYILLDVLSTGKGTPHLRHSILELILTLVLINTDEPDISESEQYWSTLSTQNQTPRTGYTLKTENIDLTGSPGNYWEHDSSLSSSNSNYLPSTYQQKWLNYHGKKVKNSQFKQKFSSRKWPHIDADSREQGHHNHHHEHQNDHHNSYNDNHMHTEANNTNTISIGDLSKNPFEPAWETSTPDDAEWDTPATDSIDYETTTDINPDEYVDPDDIEWHHPLPDNYKPENDPVDPPWQLTTPYYPTWSTPSNAPERTTTPKYPPWETVPIENSPWTTSNHNKPPYITQWDQTINPVIPPWEAAGPSYPPWISKKTYTPWEAESLMNPRNIQNYPPPAVHIRPPILWKTPTYHHFVQRSHDNIDQFSNPNDVPLESSRRNVEIIKSVTNHEENDLANLNTSALKRLPLSPYNIQNKFSNPWQSSTTFYVQTTTTNAPTWEEPTTLKYPISEIPSIPLSPLKSTIENPWTLPTNIPESGHSSTEMNDLSVLPYNSIWSESHQEPNNSNWDTTPHTESNFPWNKPANTPELQIIPLKVPVNTSLIPLKPQKGTLIPINAWDISNNPKFNPIFHNYHPAVPDDSVSSESNEEPNNLNWDTTSHTKLKPWISSTESNFTWKEPSNPTDLQIIPIKVPINEYDSKLNTPIIPLESQKETLKPINSWDTSNNSNSHPIPQNDLSAVTDKSVSSETDNEDEISNRDANPYPTFPAESNYPWNKPTNTLNLDLNRVLNSHLSPLQPQKETFGPIQTWNISKQPKTQPTPLKVFSVLPVNSVWSEPVKEAEISNWDKNPGITFLPWRPSAESNYPLMQNIPTKEPKNQFTKVNPAKPIHLNYQSAVSDNSDWREPNNEDDISNRDANHHLTFVTESNYPWNKPTNTLDLQDIPFNLPEKDLDRVLNRHVSPLQPLKETFGPIKTWSISKNPKSKPIPLNDQSVVSDYSVWDSSNNEDEISNNNWDSNPHLTLTPWNPSTDLNYPWNKPTKKPALQNIPIKVPVNEYDSVLNTPLIPLEPQKEIIDPINTWDIPKNTKSNPIPQNDLSVVSDFSAWSEPSNEYEILNRDADPDLIFVTESNYPWNKPKKTLDLQDRVMNLIPLQPHRVTPGPIKTWHYSNNPKSNPGPHKVISVISENSDWSEPVKEAEISNRNKHPRITFLPWDPSAESNYPLMKNVPTKKPEDQFNKVISNPLNHLVLQSEAEGPFAKWAISNNRKPNHFSHQNLYLGNTQAISKIPCETKPTNTKSVIQLWNRVEKFLGLKNGLPKSLAQIQKLYIILKTFMLVSREKDLENLPTQEIIKQIIKKLMLSLKIMKGEGLNENFRENSNKKYPNGISETPTIFEVLKHRPSSGLDINPQSFSAADLAEFVLNFVSILSQEIIPVNNRVKLMRSIFTKLAADIPTTDCECKKESKIKLLRKINDIVNQYYYEG